MKPIVMVLSVGRCGTHAVAEHFGFAHEPDKREPSIDALLHRIEKAQVLYGECSHYWRHRLDDLKLALPNAHYVHLVRDGRDCVSSWYQRGLFAERSKEPPLPIGLGGSRWEQCCWYWVYWNSRIMRMSNERVHIEKMGLPLTFEGPPHEAWTDEQRETFSDICGTAMEFYGYWDFMEGR